MFLQINKNFKIVDAVEKKEICEDDIRIKVNEIAEIMKKTDFRQSDVMYIAIKRSIDTVLTIIACLQLQITFTFSDSNQNHWKLDPNHRKFRTTLIFNGEYIHRIAENDENECERICYVINTSGTTGNKKQVAVPVDCIKKNIEHFCTIFNLVSSDSIIFSTSLLFDPSVIELFMAFQVGCKLILTPDNFRSEPHRMQQVIEEFRPTVAQFTPTVFEMLPSPDFLLSATSPFRILLLGGSHFPLSFINSIRSSDNTTRVFNVYGVTEVSCWATIFEVEIGCSDVSIGTEIHGSTVEVDSEGLLILGGSRQCYVNGQKSERHKTGDRVERTNESGLKLVGRVDRMVKHKGIRICLDHLSELVLREDSSIQFSYFLHLNDRNLLQFIKGPHPSSTEDSSYVKTIKIDDNNTLVTTTVIHLETIPINSSGKVDENELRRIYFKRFNESYEIVNELREILEKRLKVNLEEVLDKSFVSIGVNSLMAAELSLIFLEDQTEVMREMLNNYTTIRQFLNKFGNGKSTTIKRYNNEVVVIHVIQKRQPIMKWAVDLHKCIDGNILVIRDNLIICASHSGIVVAVNPLNGKCLWRTECKVRFECMPILVNKMIVIGCKNKGLCFLDLESGEFTKTHSYEKQLDIAVRSKCAFDGEHIYCTTENGYFHAIEPELRISKFRQCVEKNGGGTSIGPVIAPNGTIFVTTTSGCISLIRKDPFHKMNFGDQFGPIFSEPIFLDQNSILITSVHGVLTILNSSTGAFKDSITLNNENCFCSPLQIDNKLIVATQSGKIISLEWIPNLKISKIFKFNLPGISFVKTPKILDSLEQSACLLMISKNGWLLFARFDNLETFSKVTAFPISNKEVFTYPEVINNGNKKIFLIAGRDDYLRAWNFDPNDY